MARKKQTRRKDKNKLSKAKTASDKEETKLESKDNEEDANVDISAVENTAVSSQEGDVGAIESAKNEVADKDDLKRKRETELKVEESKKMKKQGEEKVLNEISIRIERW